MNMLGYHLIYLPYFMLRRYRRYLKGKKDPSRSLLAELLIEAASSDVCNEVERNFAYRILTRKYYKPGCVLAVRHNDEGKVQCDGLLVTQTYKNNDNYEWRNDSLNQHKLLEMLLICVRPEQQGRGLGQTLIHAAAEIARRKRYKGIALEVIAYGQTYMKRLNYAKKQRPYNMYSRYGFRTARRVITGSKTPYCPDYQSSAPPTESVMLVCDDLVKLKERLETSLAQKNEAFIDLIKSHSL